MILEGRKGLLTRDVLKMISYHLSSREDCKDIEYTVTIRTAENTSYDEITVSPYITVFPDTYNRKSSDRRGIAYHVVVKHFPDLFEGSDVSTVHVTKDSLVHGTYTYKKYLLTNRRRWIKLQGGH